MSLKWNGVVQRKLALLDHQVMQLQTRLQGIPREVFVEDWGLRAMAERALQVGVEIMIDVAERIIALAGAGPTATSVEAIERLVQLKVIQAPEPYRSMVRMRNLIVHGYDSVDPELLFDVLTANLKDFRRFRDEIDQANRMG